MFARKLDVLAAKNWRTDATVRGLPMAALARRADLAAMQIRQCVAALETIDLEALEKVAEMFFSEREREPAGRIVGAARELIRAAGEAAELEEGGAGGEPI